jgi:hypothetical protein
MIRHSDTASQGLLDDTCATTLITLDVMFLRILEKAQTLITRGDLSLVVVAALNVAFSIRVSDQSYQGSDLKP